MKRFYTNSDFTKTIKIEVDEYDNPLLEVPEGFIRGCGYNRGKVAYNKGWTKETHPELVEQGKLISEKLKGRSPVNKGRTKEDYEPLNRVSLKNKGKSHPAYNKGIPRTAEQKKKQSDSMKGKEPYNKGKTKETCSSLKSASEKLKGHKCFVTDWDHAKAKERETKKKNGTSNSSNPEKEFFKNLIEKYGEEDVFTLYYDAERYPFNCDFYIKSEDKFIEYLGTIEHNGRPFNPESYEDVQELEKLTELANKKGPDSRYWNIIKWWTQTDPLKLQTLRKNNLNFELVYPNLLIINE